MFNDNQEDSFAVPEEDRIKIRETVSSLSFQELLSMKEEMGSKLYNKTIFETSKTNKQRELKRVNKNRPREISSKLKPKQVTQILSSNATVSRKKSLPRDPRFDPLCGQFDDKVFKDNYKFVGDIRQREKNTLEKELKACTDSDRKNVLKLLIQRMDNQIREQTKIEMKNKKEFEEKLEAREKLRNGEVPVYKKKSVKKLESLIEKFETLKKSNRINKHIERRSKKLRSKDRIKLENQGL